MNTQEVCKCPICFDDISDKNNITTECGHKFHASCLITNVIRNGFNCPCCRTVMVTPYENENEKECYSDTGTSYSDDSYDSYFRTRYAFESNNDEVNDSEIPISTLPTVEHTTIENLTNQFVESGLTINDLVGAIVIVILSSDIKFQIHMDIRDTYNNIWNKIDLIIENYKNHQEIIDVSPVVEEEPLVRPVRETIHPEIPISTLPTVKYMTNKLVEYMTNKFVESGITIKDLVVAIVISRISSDLNYQIHMDISHTYNNIWNKIDLIIFNINWNKIYFIIENYKKHQEINYVSPVVEEEPVRVKIHPSIIIQKKIKMDFTNLDQIRKDLQSNYPCH
jgi:hypothetical protein